MTIILILIALVVLGYFGIDIEKIANSPAVRKNASYVWNLIQYAWANYIWWIVVKLWFIILNAVEWFWNAIVSIFNWFVKLW